MAIWYKSLSQNKILYTIFSLIQFIYESLNQIKKPKFFILVIIVLIINVFYFVERILFIYF